ncbi:MAG: sigma-70 family RNA polymerase sigma factor [Anaerobacillus sp.]
MNDELFRLIHGAKKGNEQAYNKLVVMYKEKVYRHAFAMLHDRTGAEDITQEAFIKAYYSLNRLEHEYAFVSWLTRIVHNLCQDRLKKQKREAKKQAKMRADLPLRYSEKHEGEQVNMKLSIQEAMQQLSSEHRSVLILCDLEGFSYEEISHILKIPLGTVKSRIYQARNYLKSELKRGEDYD